MIDFTALEKKTAPKNTPKSDFSKGGKQVTLESEKPATEENRPPTGEAVIITRLQRQKQQREELHEVTRQQAEAIAKIGGKLAELLAGIDRGEAPEKLLVEALEIIGDITGERVTAQTAKQRLLDIYGLGLGHPAPLEEELAEIESRIALLTRPELEKMRGQENRERAIKEHRRRAEEIRGLLEREATK